MLTLVYSNIIIRLLRWVAMPSLTSTGTQTEPEHSEGDFAEHFRQNLGENSAFERSSATDQYNFVGVDKHLGGRSHPFRGIIKSGNYRANAIYTTEHLSGCEHCRKTFLLVLLRLICQHRLHITGFTRTGVDQVD